ncbi:phosphofurin acidic cluster sorting protein [Anaeramoeba ignava]|uniref:Phosphofurin acidic cluster sorting protein n=1 Tax=Anaeramoeba ignava TaxID=1746090 RepID=A0A9Q0LB52_ANAIG|nr:phosphofurin acidic cluster sorting protein [Anaeramoeba ignava]
MNEENKSLKSSLKKSNSANSYPLMENIFLLKAGKRRTQKLLPWINLSSLQGKLIWIQNFLDIQQTFSTVVKYQQKIKTNRTPFKIVVLGSDVFITEILRSYVDILSKTQKPLELIKFYILPIGKKIDIALHIASLDSQYRTLFIHSNWKNLFDEQEKFTNQEIEFIVSSMDKYIYGGKYTTLLNINEAFLTIKGEDSDSLIIQKTIPFLKSMKIGEQKDFEKQNEHVSEPPRVSLDYWVRHQKDKKEIKEKDEKKKESKKERKDKKITKHVTLEFVVATPLRTIALALKLDQNELPISGESFSLLTVYTDKKRNLSSKKETKYQRRALQISKLLAKTLDNKKGFVVNIDSIDWTGVSLITIRPQWNSQTKYFPLAVFNKV